MCVGEVGLDFTLFIENYKNPKIWEYGTFNLVVNGILVGSIGFESS